MRIEETILKHLVYDDEYARKVLPFVKPEYFTDSAEKQIYEKISEFIIKYNALPTPEALSIECEQIRGISESDYQKIQTSLKDLKTKPDATNPDWLLENTERFCQERAVFNAIMDSISIIDGKDKSRTKDALPEILKSALSISFDSHVGHDFLEDYEERYDYYHRIEEKIPFDLEYLNKITKGGLSKKTLNILLAGTGVGKTLAMCHMAAANLRDGKNVLYITMEMSEEKIGERIDANLLDTMLDDLALLPKDVYEKKVNRVRSKTAGKMIIKEYPTATAHVGHFRHLLNELYLKRNFKPDIIYVDYLNICMSARVKQGANVNSYTYIKAIAEELRGLAVEYKVPIVSATQTTRTGFQNSDPDLTDTSESFGLPATADFMIALINTEQLQDLDQIMIKQLKNRYADLAIHRRFVIGVDRARMKLYDVEQDAQTLQDDSSVMDKSAFGERQREDDTMGWATKTKGRKDFSGLKVS